MREGGGKGKSVKERTSVSSEIWLTRQFAANSIDGLYKAQLQVQYLVH